MPVLSKDCGIPRATPLHVYEDACSESLCCPCTSPIRRMASCLSSFQGFSFTDLSKSYVSGITGMCSARIPIPRCSETLLLSRWPNDSSFCYDLFWSFPVLPPARPALSFVLAHRSSSVGLVLVWCSWQRNAYDSGEVGQQSGCLIPGICHLTAKRLLKQWQNGSDLPRKKHCAPVPNHNTVKCQPLHHSQDNWNNRLPSESLCLQLCLAYHESRPRGKMWKENPQHSHFIGCKKK